MVHLGLHSERLVVFNTAWPSIFPSLFLPFLRDIFDIYYVSRSFSYYAEEEVVPFYRRYFHMINIDPVSSVARLRVFPHL